MTTYNIFISHAWRYSEHYKKVVQWINEAQDEGKLNWKNYSVPKHNPLLDPDDDNDKQKLKNELDEQIRPVSLVIVLAGMYATYSDWIDYEINTAVSYGKYIIGVKPWRQARIPSVVSENSKVLVGWNKDSIINAILNS